MLRVNGLYGHVARNNLKSIYVFAGFAVAFQIISAVVLTPYLLFLDANRFWAIAPIEYVKVYGFPAFVFGSVYFAINFYLHVNTIQRDLGFHEADPCDRQRIHQIVGPLSITAGIKEPEIAILETDACNAFVCGWRKNYTTLVITRGLLNALNDDELAAVIAHEIIHIKNGDIQLMAFANVAVSCVKLIEKMNIFRVKSGKRFIVFIILWPLLFLFIMMTILVNLTMYIGTTISKVSRLVIASSREFIADAEAVRLTHNSASLISALIKIDGRSTIEGLDPMVEAMMIDGAAMGEFATHPTIGERISALRQLTGSMAYVPPAQPAFGSSRPTFAHTLDTPSPSAALRQKAGMGDLAQPIFGKRNLEQSRTSDEAQSLFKRVNVGSEAPAHGIPEGVMKLIRWGLIAMFGFQLLAVWQFNNTMSSVERELGGATQINKPINTAITVKKP